MEEKTPLTRELIDTYNMPYRIHKPDWDDVAIEFTLPCGIEVGGLIVCNNESTEPDEFDLLTGMEDFLVIETKEELDKVYNMSLEELCDYIETQHPEFDREEYV